MSAHYLDGVSCRHCGKTVEDVGRNGWVRCSKIDEAGGDIDPRLFCSYACLASFVYSPLFAILKELEQPQRERMDKPLKTEAQVSVIEEEETTR